jgi:organic radical activating enzyme
MEVSTAEPALIAHYSAASTAATKLLQAKSAIVLGRIRPKHLQLMPTNRCNGNCSWCACAQRDRTAELGLDELKRIASHFARLGVDAITLTGGGEPTLHDGFERFVEFGRSLDCHIGVVTNGIIWSKLRSRSMLDGLITWARVSVTDTESGEYDAERLARIAEAFPSTDLGVSFTVTPSTSIVTAQAVARIVQATDYTHVRYIEDAVHGASARMTEVEAACVPLTAKGVYQRHSAPASGAKRCLAPLLRPVIDPTGYVFPCCRVQHADGGERQTLDMSPAYRMGRWERFAELAPFDGSACAKCYYGEYNSALAQLTQPLVHERFL